MRTIISETGRGSLLTILGAGVLLLLFLTHPTLFSHFFHWVFNSALNNTHRAVNNNPDLSTHHPAVSHAHR